MSHFTGTGPPGNAPAANRMIAEPTSRSVINALHASAIGVDVHHNLLVCAYQRSDHDAGLIRTEIAEFGCSSSEILRFAQWCRARNPGVILMESTGVLWRSAYESLEDFGFTRQQLALVNARDVKAVAGRKTDKQDAVRLVEFARLGSFSKSFVPDRKVRYARSVARAYRKAKGDLSRHLNRYQKTLNSTGCRASIVFSNVNGKAARIILDACISGDPNLEEVIRKNCGRLKASPEEIRDALNFRIPPEVKELLRNERHHLGNLEARCAELMGMLARLQKPWEPLIELLSTIPGVKKDAARLILAETGDDLSDFSRSEGFASWCGLCPGNNKSAGKEHGSRRPKGNRYIRTVITECAHAVALSRKGWLYERSRAFRVRMSYKKAIGAMAHLLCRIIFSILKTGREFDPRPTNAFRDACARKVARAAALAIESNLGVSGNAVYDRGTGEVVRAVRPTGS